MESYFIVVAVAALSWLLAQFLLRRDIQRALRRSRRYRIVLASFGGLYGVAVFFSIVGSIEIKVAIAFGSAGILGYVLLRARPGFGRWRGWPPGSMPLFNQMDLVDDRFLIKKKEAHGPVFKTTTFIQPTLCIYGLERGQELIRRHRPHLTFGGMRFSEFIPQGFIRFMDRSAHAHYRPILANLMAPTIIQNSAPKIAAAIRKEFAQLETTCRNEEGLDVRLHDYMPNTVLRIFLVLFFGVSQNTKEMRRFEELYRTLDCREYLKLPKKHSRQALAELVNLVRTTCADPPREDDANFSYYLCSLLDENPSLLNDETLTGNIVCMLQLGAYDVAGLLLWILKHISDNSAWQERLYAESSCHETFQEVGLIDRIISETLRLEQSEFILRQTAGTFEFEGFRIPKDWRVRICVRESHRDPDLFNKPERFDPDRFLGKSLSTRIYAPFGSGETSCLARRLTYAVAGAFLYELVTHYSWTVLEDGPRMNDGFHWAPSKEFRIRLHSRANSVTASVPYDGI